MSSDQWTLAVSAIVALLAAAVPAYLKLSSLWHSQEGETLQRLVKEYQGVTEQQRTMLAECRKELHDALNRLQSVVNELSLCKAARARAEERIVAYEELLTRHEVKYRPWRPNDSAPALDVES